MTPALIKEFIELPRDKDRAIALAIMYTMPFTDVPMYATDPYLINFVKTRMEKIKAPITEESIGGTLYALKVSRIAFSIVTDMPIEDVMTHIGNEYLTDFVKYRLDKENSNA